MLRDAANTLVASDDTSATGWADTPGLWTLAGAGTYTDIIDLGAIGITGGNIQQATFEAVVTEQFHSATTNATVAFTLETSVTEAFTIPLELELAYDPVNDTATFAEATLVLGYRPFAIDRLPVGTKQYIRMKVDVGTAALDAGTMTVAIIDGAGQTNLV